MHSNHFSNPCSNKDEISIVIYYIITPYIRMQDFDWLVASVFFAYSNIFSSFQTNLTVFHHCRWIRLKYHGICHFGYSFFTLASIFPPFISDMTVVIPVRLDHFFPIDPMLKPPFCLVEGIFDKGQVVIFFNLNTLY